MTNKDKASYGSWTLCTKHGTCLVTWAYHSCLLADVDSIHFRRSFLRKMNYEDKASYLGHSVPSAFCSTNTNRIFVPPNGWAGRGTSLEVLYPTPSAATHCNQIQICQPNPNMSIAVCWSSFVFVCVEQWLF